jgi:ABC-type multidrug transport system ATPase subunit
MRMLTCFFPPTSGTARICGLDILKEPLEVRRKLGYLSGDMGCIENVRGVGYRLVPPVGD